MTLVTRILAALSIPQIISHGKAAGLRLDTGGAAVDFLLGTYEEPVQEAISTNLAAGSVFYDIGANIGFFSLLAARLVGAEGRVYAFEPVPQNAATIVRNASINGIDVIEVFAEAVGAQTGRTDLLLARHAGGASLALAGAPPDMVGRIEVEMTTLDDAVAHRRIRPPSLVKIDVEGAELEVLSGMSSILERHRPRILCEIDAPDKPALDRKADEVTSFLEVAGYDFTVLSPSYPPEGWQVKHILAQRS